MSLYSLNIVVSLALCFAFELKADEHDLVEVTQVAAEVSHAEVGKAPTAEENEITSLTVFTPIDGSEAARDDAVAAARELVEQAPVPKIALINDIHFDSTGENTETKGKPTELTWTEQFKHDLKDPIVWKYGLQRVVVIAGLRAVFIIYDMAKESGFENLKAESIFEPKVLFAVGLAGVMTKFFQLIGNSYNKLLNKLSEKRGKVGPIPTWLAIDFGHNTFWFFVTEVAAKLLGITSIASKGYDEIAGTSLINGSAGTLTAVNYGRFVEHKRGKAMAEAREKGDEETKKVSHRFERYKVALAFFLTVPEYMIMQKQPELGLTLMGVQALIGLSFFNSPRAMFDAGRASFVAVVEKTRDFIVLSSNSFKDALLTFKVLAQTAWTACRTLSTNSKGSASEKETRL